MKLRVFTEPQQGATYDDLARVARATEDLGFDAFFRSDHFHKMGDIDGLPGPTDSWLTLAALGRETKRIRLGTLVTSATFRHPGPLAISVAQADQMSGGRIDFGLGAGWFEAEHRAYGIPFYDTAERFDRFEEQVEIIHGLLHTEPDQSFSFAGRHYQVIDSPALPKPVQARVPFILGGAGKRRSAALAARFADEYNAGFKTIEETASIFGGVATAVDAAGRPADSMTYSAAHTFCVATSDAELSRRAQASGRTVDQLRADGIAGTPDEVVERVARYAEIGVTTMYVQILDLADLDHLELIASEVARQL